MTAVFQGQYGTSLGTSMSLLALALELPAYCRFTSDRIEHEKIYSLVLAGYALLVARRWAVAIGRCLPQEPPTHWPVQARCNWREAIALHGPFLRLLISRISCVGKTRPLRPPSTSILPRSAWYTFPLQAERS